jgi:hypothetical protein
MNDVAEPAERRRHDWAAIEHAYRVENLSIKEVCERFDVPRSTFYYRARQKGWPLPLDESRPVRDAAGLDDDLARRFRRAAVKRLCDLERPTALGDGLGGELKVMEGIMRILERLDRLAEAQAKRAPVARVWSPEELNRRRAALADKLIKMLEQERGCPLPD